MRPLVISTALAVAACLGASPGISAEQNQPICLRTTDNGDLDCSYRTVAQCEATRRGNGLAETCLLNPNLTTGQGSFTQRQPRRQLIPNNSAPLR